MKGLLVMTGTAKFLLSMYGLLIVHHGSVEAAYTMNETCLYYPEGYIANPDNCQAWGYCSGGQLLAQGTCPTGFLYDTYKGICNYASQVQCGTTAADICANLAEPGYIAVPDNCAQYCYCSNKKIVQCNACPPNQLYNPKDEQCVYDYTCPADSVCRLVKNNAFVGATTCGQYIRCLDGSGSAQSCPNNYYFNKLTGNCQPTNPCTSDDGTETSSPTTFAPNAAECSSYNTAEKGTQYLSDDSTCYGYYSCSSKTGSGTWRTCPFGTNFNPANQNCVSPVDYACKFNRCANINLQFVAAPFTDCKQYYVCKNQQQSATAYACPDPKYPYFDEVNGGCVETRPNYPICTATQQV